MSARDSSAKTPVGKELLQAKLAQAWARTIATHFEGSKTKFAAAIGCHPDTISNALAGTTTPDLTNALNSLIACPNALDEALALYGLQLIPREAQMTPDMQALRFMSKAMANFIDALRDGKRDHRETLELAEQFRPVVAALTAIIHEAEGLKAA